MLSVIIPARNDGPMTARCLEHALGSVDRLKLRCEFLLIDDASAPEERILEIFRQARARGAPHHFTIIRTRTHQHYTGVFSIGLSFATGDPIFFLSNDMLVTPSFLGTQLMVSALGPQFGIVRGTSNYVDSHPEHQVIPNPMPATYPEVEAYSRSVAEANGCAYVEDKLLSGDAVLLKRALVERIGVLDTRFFGYFGDVDYGMRAHLAGFKLVCAKGAWLFHRGGGHVHRESQLAGEADVKAAYRRRLDMVEEAYTLFRQKWGIERPLRYPEVKESYFFGQAEAAAARVPLKCEMPESILRDVELY
jgi:GT2 family glycosyltransferase